MKISIFRERQCLISFIFNLNLCSCPCMYVYVMCVLVLAQAEDVLDEWRCPSCSGIIGSCEPPDTYMLGSELGSSLTVASHLTTKPFLQS